MMRRFRSVLVGGTLAALLASGCAGVPPAQVIQTAGTILGSAIAPGVGAPIGSLVGLLTGLVVQGQVDKANQKHERKDLSDRLGAGDAAHRVEASATPGEPVRVWVDETVQDGRLVAGHFDVRQLP
ncbi:MAG: hypothetical protein HY599_06935 [Candidatus Omnitrophica bacterium]|nr:hypothetical protein [Candidatus Omnitrophota bacterium]